MTRRYVQNEVEQTDKDKTRVQLAIDALSATVSLGYILGQVISSVINVFSTRIVTGVWKGPQQLNRNLVRIQAHRLLNWPCK